MWNVRPYDVYPSFSFMCILMLSKGRRRESWGGEHGKQEQEEEVRTNRIRIISGTRQTAAREGTTHQESRGIKRNTPPIPTSIPALSVVTFIHFKQWG